MVEGMVEGMEESSSSAGLSDEGNPLWLIAGGLIDAASGSGNESSSSSRSNSSRTGAGRPKIVQYGKALICGGALKYTTNGRLLGVAVGRLSPNTAFAEVEVTPCLASQPVTRASVVPAVLDAASKELGAALPQSRKVYQLSSIASRDRFGQSVNSCALVKVCQELSLETDAEQSTELYASKSAIKDSDGRSHRLLCFAVTTAGEKAARVAGGGTGSSDSGSSRGRGSGKGARCARPSFGGAAARGAARRRTSFAGSVGSCGGDADCSGLEEEDHGDLEASPRDALDPDRFAWAKIDVNDEQDIEILSPKVVGDITEKQGSLKRDGSFTGGAVRNLRSSTDARHLVYVRRLADLLESALNECDSWLAENGPVDSIFVDAWAERALARPPPSKCGAGAGRAVDLDDEEEDVELRKKPGVPFDWKEETQSFVPRMVANGPDGMLELDWKRAAVLDDGNFLAAELPKLRERRRRSGGNGSGGALGGHGGGGGGGGGSGDGLTETQQRGFDAMKELMAQAAAAAATAGMTVVGGVPPPTPAAGAAAAAAATATGTAATAAPPVAVRPVLRPLAAAVRDLEAAVKKLEIMKFSLGITDAEFEAAKEKARKKMSPCRVQSLLGAVEDLEEMLATFRGMVPLYYDEETFEAMKADHLIKLFDE